MNYPQSAIDKKIDYARELAAVGNPIESIMMVTGLSRYVLDIAINIDEIKESIRASVEADRMRAFRATAEIKRKQKGTKLDHREAMKRMLERKSAE